MISVPLHVTIFCLYENSYVEWDSKGDLYFEVFKIPFFNNIKYIHILDDQENHNSNRVNNVSFENNYYLEILNLYIIKVFFIN